ncbi:MAG: HAD family hydrolase, partial [Desulfobulbaceae bacterium]|nr:HAD family hydrolase [Desulfobulbaceae bacterium]
RLKLRNDFSVIIGAEDFAHKKPDPEPFLKAAIGLRTPPANCLAFEDSESGIQSALGAGMQTWCVATSPKSKEIGLKYKVPIIHDYNEFPISALGTDFSH